MNYTHHNNGRLWVGWKHDRCKLERCEAHPQYIAVKITPINSLVDFHIVFVYGLHNVRDRRLMWQGLDKLVFNSPCLFIGDFNAVYKEDHRRNGAQVTTYEMYDMLQWIETKELHPITEKGHAYSWSNREEGENRTLTKIDHALGDLQWMTQFSHATVRYANPQSSDHTPLIINLQNHDQHHSKPFRFFNYLCDHHEFLKVVEDAWRMDVGGTGLQKLWHKLNNVKRSLKKLHTREFAGIQSKIKTWEEALDKVQSDLQHDPSRCMIKMDLRKAYDSVSWGFLTTVMQEMGFPPRFVE